MKQNPVLVFTFHEHDFASNMHKYVSHDIIYTMCRA